MEMRYNSKIGIMNHNYEKKKRLLITTAIFTAQQTAANNCLTKITKR